MSFIAAEDILEAKKMDLLTFLRNYEPQELVHPREKSGALKRGGLEENPCGIFLASIVL